MRLLVMATLWLLAPTSWGGETILQRLDHFYAASTQPEQLYTFFNETLGIPAVWQYQSYGSFASGGVTFGNAVFETVLFPGFEGATRFSGIAYLPREHADETRKQFEQMNVELGESAPFSQSVDGVDQVWWENMTVSRLSSPLMNVFICDYKDRRFNNRHAALDELQKRGGGPLGLLGLLSIQVGAIDAAQKQQDWSKTLQDDSMDGNFSIDEGPQISVVQADTDEILGIVLKVGSLEEAKVWLESNDLLGEASLKTIQIAPSAVQGLAISLVE